MRPATFIRSSHRRLLPPRCAYRLLLWALVVLVTDGCGTRVTGLQSDPSFTYQNLSRDGIAIGGVSYLFGRNFPAMQDQMASLLKESIIRERPDIIVQPVYLVPGALGQAEYRRMLADYWATGEVAETWLEQLSGAAGRTQYAVFARIERDDFATSESSGADTNTTTYTMSRTVRTSFQVYDLTRRISVWSGSLSKTKSRSTKVREEEEESHGILGDLIEDIVESVVQDALGLTPTPTAPSSYPKAPELTELLRSIFEGFAEHLPEPGS